MDDGDRQDRRIMHDRDDEQSIGNDVAFAMPRYVPLMFVILILGCKSRRVGRLKLKF